MRYKDRALHIIKFEGTCNNRRCPRYCKFDTDRSNCERGIRIMKATQYLNKIKLGLLNEI